MVSIRHVPHFLSMLFSELLRRHVFGNSVKVGINHTVGITFTTLAHKSYIRESCVQKHFPDVGVTPEVGLLLRPNLDSKVVMLSFKSLSYRHFMVHRHTDEVLAELLKGLFESTFIIFSFTLSITNDTL